MLGLQKTGGITIRDYLPRGLIEPQILYITNDYTWPNALYEPLLRSSVLHSIMGEIVMHTSWSFSVYLDHGQHLEFAYSTDPTSNEIPVWQEWGDLVNTWSTKKSYESESTKGMKTCSITDGVGRASWRKYRAFEKKEEFEYWTSYSKECE